MPIEIKELNIKINVTDNQNKSEAEAKDMDDDTRNEIINQCVEQVMEILSKNHER